MPKTETAYKKNFDQDSFREVRPAAAGIISDKNGVYLTGFLFFEGEIWSDVESNSVSLKKVFKLSKCKGLIDESEIRYSHKAIINEDSNWGMACYYVKLDGVDPASFKYIKPSTKGNSDKDGYYFRDNSNAFYLDADKEIIFPINCASSETLVAIDVMAVDSKHAFFKGKRIAKSDARSFRKLDTCTYADARHRYENENWSRLNIAVISDLSK